MRTGKIKRGTAKTLKRGAVAKPCRFVAALFPENAKNILRQAYGFRDLEYFKLKIYQLPQINCVKAL
jgi:hypothetical protein